MGDTFTVLVGLALFAGSFVLLFWNEGRAVKTATGLKDIGKQVVSIPADTVDPAMEGNVVHLTGEATTDETLADADLGVSAVAIKLQRNVEIYQWKEEEQKSSRKKVGGRKETTPTYSYKKVWTSAPITKKFKKQVVEGNLKAFTHLNLCIVITTISMFHPNMIYSIHPFDISSAHIF